MFSQTRCLDSMQCVKLLFTTIPCSSLLLLQNYNCTVFANYIDVLYSTLDIYGKYSTIFAFDPPMQSKIKTHDSESRGQEEAGRTRRTSELFTRSTALKFVNALNKPP